MNISNNVPREESCIGETGPQIVADYTKHNHQSLLRNVGGISACSHNPKIQ
jgi:hypothetical protein